VHSLKFGFTFERIQYYVGSGGLLLNQNNGSFSFTNTTASGVLVRDGLENFLTNRPFSGSPVTPLAAVLIGLGNQVEPRDSLFGGYIQDDWRARPNLTLNLGVRYEMLTNPTEAHNKFSRLSTFYAPAGSGPCPNIYPNPFIPTTVPGCPSPIQNLFDRNPTLRNFDPRVGFSWDPFHDGKTAVRAGFGIFDVLPLPYIYSDGFTSAYPFSLGLSSPIPNGQLPQGSFPSVPPVTLTASLPGGRYVEPDPGRSYSMDWNLNIQRQIAKNTSVMVGYVGSHTVHNSFTTDSTNIVLPTLVNGVLTWPLPVGSGTVLDPNVKQIRQIFFDNTARYEGLQAQIKLSPTHGLQLQSSYTFGRCFSGGDAAQFGDPFQNSLTSLLYFDPQNRYGPCDFDLRQNFSTNYLYAIPGPRSDSALNWVAGGWQLGGIITASTGVPFTVITGGDPLGTTSTEPFDFPNRVPGCNPIAGGVHYVNTSCFVIAPLTPAGPVLGNSGRNSLTGPGLLNVDTSLIKNTRVPKISETFNVQLRFEVFNVFNRPNLEAPVDNNSMAGNLGLIDSTQTRAREIQLGAKIIW
jgi:hypothetical protein